LAAAIECPTCSRKLKLPDSLAGKSVVCPGCRVTFTAPVVSEVPVLEEVGTAPAEAKPRPPARDERAACPVCGAYVSLSTAFCPQCGAEFDEGCEEGERPWEHGGRQRLDTVPHRGALVLTAGIIGVVFLTFCPFISPVAGIAAWLMGASDLRAMKEGRMDDAGRGITMAGFILGIIASSIGGLSLLALAAMWLISALA
jgi:hypothetical protein